jgi:RimJ/RimL family protein N-acetyltransferase
MSERSRIVPGIVVTDRLRLRRWIESDRMAFAAMNADPRVMKHFPCVLSQKESDAVAGRIGVHFERHGFGLWAVEIPAVTPFAGFIGLSIPTFDAHFTPCVEIGWRLAAAYWGRGYATEGARAVVAVGFDAIGLEEIVSMTVAANRASRNVMEKIGMVRDPSDDFDHPVIATDHPLRRHALYRLRRDHHVLG